MEGEKIGASAGGRWTRRSLWIFTGCLIIGAGWLVGLWVFGDIPPPDDSDLMPEPVEVPEGENGYLVLFELPADADRLNEVAEINRDAMDGAPWDARRARRALEENTATLEVIERALALPRFVAPRGKPSLPLAPLLMMDLLYLQGLERIHERDGRGALAAATTLLQFAYRFERASGGLAVYRFGSLSLRLASLELAEQAVGETPDAAALREFLRAARMCPLDGASLESTLKVDYHRQVLAIEAERTSSGCSVIDRWLFKPNRTRAALAERYRRVIRAARADEPRVEAPSREVNVGPLNSLGRQLVDVWNADHMLESSYTGPRLSFVLHVTALAVRLHELERGELPASLDALVPDYLDTVPLDPYDSQPLGYSAPDRAVFSSDGLRVGLEEEEG